MWTIGYWYEEGTHLNGVKPEGFAEFMRTLKPHPGEIYDTLHQHRVLDEEIDFILRFETLQRDSAGFFGDAVGEGPRGGDATGGVEVGTENVSRVL
jgi:hypothetical protein